MKLFAPVQNEANHELEEMLGFPLLREGTRLGWLMNLNSVSGPPCLHSCTYSLDRDWQNTLCKLSPMDIRFFFCPASCTH